MSRPDYDVIVVGGGINGVGVAQAAAAAGQRVLLLEKTALAAGTSSKSSKLVHGGLRYLESFEFGLVHESLQERELLLKNAPELVSLQSFLLPLYSYTRRGPLLLRTGLSLYWLLSGFSDDASFATVPRGQWGQLQGLLINDLVRVFRYYDARTDDAALTRAVMASAADFGAELKCPAELLHAEIHAEGCELSYREGSAEHTVTGRVLVNAAGPWVNQVAERVQTDLPRLPVELVQGSHIEVPGEAVGNNNEFFYLESPRDGRAVFVMPHEDRWVVGTTETRYRDNPDKVKPLSSEESYLLGVLKYYFPAYKKFERKDLLTSWAGLRVLPSGEGHAFHRSRETILHTDDDVRPRFLSIYGGKLTTYRATAEKVCRKIAPSLPDKKPLADTRELTLKPA
ncbi:MAG: glycerol-3-phosphate dehydrogenase/oxidase [Gammaproteobacteria bacterium]